MPTSSSRAPDRGFTLLELLVALAVAGVLVAALPRLGGGGPGLEETARALTLDLRAARDQALRTGAPRAVRFDLEAGAWTAEGGAGGRLPEGVGLDLVAGLETAGPAGLPGIVFFEDGSATGGEIRLREGQDAVRIAVRWLTGRITRDG